MNQTSVDKIHQFIKAANKAIKEGDNRAAMLALGGAAKIYDSEAQNTDSQNLRATYLQQANKLLEQIKRMKKQGIKPENKAIGNADIPTVTFNDVIGLEEAKEEIAKRMIRPVQNAEIYRKYGLRPGGNILLYGPPGTGKTLFAKAVAHEVNAKFVYVKSGELINSLLGETEKNIDKLFVEVRSQVKKFGRVIMFFDEFDSLARKRSGDDKVSLASVNALLQQLDGIGSDNDSIAILAATNNRDMLDDAVLSRFAAPIFIPLPSAEDCGKILALHLKHFSDGADFSKLGELAEGLSGRALTQIADNMKNILAENEVNTGKVSKITFNQLAELIEEKKNAINMDDYKE